MLTVSIESFKFNCIIGILDHERLKEQEVTIDIHLSYKVDKNLEKFIDYAILKTFIQEHMTEKKFLTIENAVFSICDQLSSIYNFVEAIDLKIAKTSILHNATPSVKIFKKLK